MKKIICFVCFWALTFCVQLPSAYAGADGFKDRFEENQWANKSAATVQPSPSLRAEEEAEQPIGGDPISDGLSILLVASAAYGVYLFKRKRSTITL
jgi:hypothetical protein